MHFPAFDLIRSLQTKQRICCSISQEQLFHRHEQRLSCCSFTFYLCRFTSNPHRDMTHTRSQSGTLVAQSSGRRTFIIDTLKRHTPTHPAPMGSTMARILQSDAPTTSIAFCPDSTLLATGSWDNTTKLWRVADGMCIATLTGHTAHVKSVAFNADGTMLATGSNDRTAKLWRVADGACTATLTGHTNNVTSVAFSPDGKMLATGSWDSTAKMWRVADGACIATFPGHFGQVTSIAFSPDGTLLATGRNDSMMKLWRVADGECTATFAGHIGQVMSVAFSPDGTLLATGSWDNTARLWRVADGVCTATLAGHTNTVTSVAFSPDGTLIATGSNDKTTKLWHIAGGVCAVTLSGHTNNVTSIAFSPDGTLLATGSWDKTTKLWRVSDGVCTATLAGHAGYVTSVAFSPDGTMLATGSGDKTTKLWRTCDGKCTATLSGHTMSVTSVAFSPDGTQLATCSDDKTTKLWRVADGVCTATLTGHTGDVRSVAFSPDGTLLATGSWDNTARLWRVADGVCTATLTGHTESVMSTAFSPDGTMLATGSWDKTTKMWRVADGVCTATLADHIDFVTSVAFSPDGTLLATGSDDKETKLWRVADRVCTATLTGHTNNVTSVAFSPDGTQLATGSDDDTTKLWRVADGVCTATLAGHITKVTSVAFSPDGTQLATGSWDNTTKLWRVADGVCTATLTGHTNNVTSVAFSPDGTQLATSSNDTTKLWRIADGACTATLTGQTDTVTSLAFSGDGTMLATLGRDGLCFVWVVGNEEPVGKADVGGTFQSGDLSFVSSDDQCCVLEHSYGLGSNRFSVELHRSNVLKSAENYAAKAKRSIPVFPHTSQESITLEESIAGGSSCVVHRCNWRGRSYALKLYHRNIISQIAREVAVVPYLQHPNIVRVVAIVDVSNYDAQTAGLLMELASSSLGGKLAKAPCPPRETLLRWLHEVAQGIEFAHGCGIVHSDIKPDNIMIVGNEEQQAVAKVTDFGSASILSTTGTSTTTVHGTPMFIAPEYAAGNTGPTRASDVFSFGMTMWCALVPQGTEHGLGRTDIQVAMALHMGRRPPVAAIDASLVGLIERCWAADPSARPRMVEVEEALRSLVVLPKQLRPTPSMLLWSTLLQPLGVEAAFQQLQFQQNGHLFLSPALDAAHACHRLICTAAGSRANDVQRVDMVGTDAPTANCFATLHEAEMNSRALNPALRIKNPTDAASVAALDRLKQSFVPVTTAPGDPLPCARLLLAWHGTSSDKVDAVCRDGPRSLRTTDCGYFGAGSYFALEAAYALNYSSRDPASGESAAILYAVSVSQAKVITPQGDYRQVEDLGTLHLHGFSKYYSGNPDAAVALAPRCDAHFIPVKEYGHTHPLTGLRVVRGVGYQAVDESSDEAEGHEIVIASHHRCIPIAVVYFKN